MPASTDGMTEVNPAYAARGIERWTFLHMTMLVGLFESDTQRDTPPAKFDAQLAALKAADLSADQLRRALVFLAERAAAVARGVREQVELAEIMGFQKHPDSSQPGLNLPTLSGSLMGAGLAVVRDKPLCHGCAFRQGTVANQTIITQADVRHSFANIKRFMCHEGCDPRGEPTKPCAGYVQALRMGCGQ